MDNRLSRLRNCGLRSLAAIAGLLAVADPSAAVPAAPLAPATSTGSYTVSFTPCTGCSGAWLEERVGTSGSWQTIGNGTVSFSNKAPGSYGYRVAELYFNPLTYSIWTDYGPIVTVLVGGNLPERPPLAEQLSYRYRARAGDIDGDGRTDLFVERTKDRVELDGTLDDVLLRRLSGGRFKARVPSSTEASVARTWPRVDVRLEVRDVNIDGFADLLLTDLSSIAGFRGALDQILFAPGRVSIAAPKGIRAVDAGLGSFANDVRAYLQDPDYFSSNASVQVDVQTYYDMTCTYSYDPIYYVPIQNCYPVERQIVLAYPDYSAFDEAAVEIWCSESEMADGQAGAQEVYDAIDREIEDVLDVAIGGWDLNELLGRRDAIADPDTRRGMSLFSVLAGIATAGADEPGDDDGDGRDDAVLLTGRRIIGFGPFHTALEYAGSTISAHDTDPRAFVDGTLVSQVDWPPDHPSLTLKIATVSSALSPPLYWARLLLADSRYDDDLDYDLIPSVGAGGYNSNSYTSGIIAATAGVPGVPMARYIGGERPVPATEFN